MKAIIVDDEKGGREILSKLLGDHCPDVEVIGQAASVELARGLIQQAQPDLVFLDIEMPKEGGFALLEWAAENPVSFRVVFTTAHDRYAAKAFRYAVVDYLLKPIDVAELKEAVKRALTQPEDNLKQILRAFRQVNTSPFRLKLSTRDGYEWIDVEQIVYCRSEANYTRFILATDRNILVSKTMKVFQPDLEDHGFFRIHKSSIVNVSRVKRYYHGKGGYVEMDNGDTLDVSNDRKTDFLQTLG